MGRFLAVSVACLLAFNASAWAGVAWEHSYQAALEKAKKETKLVMVDMYADWCGPCRRLDKDTFANKEVSEKLSKEFIAVKIDIERSKEAAELAGKFGANAIPHIIFVDADGKKISDFIGYVTAAEFLKQLNQVAEKAQKK